MTPPIKEVIAEMRETVGKNYLDYPYDQLLNNITAILDYVAEIERRLEFYESTLPEKVPNDQTKNS